jgi:hypothetical protein
MAEEQAVNEEYTDNDLADVVNKIYGGGEEKSSEEVIQESVQETTEAPTEVEEAPVQINDKDLPPGFEPASKDRVETSEGDSELSESDINKAIEDAPNDGYKNNIVRMRKSLEANKQKIAEQTSIIKQLQELNIVDEEGNIDTSKASGELAEQLEAAYDKLGRIDLMQDPRFISKYGEPIKAQLTTISDIIKSAVGEDVNANQIALQVANMPPVDRIKFMQENLPEEYRLAITPYFAKIDDIAAERNAAIEQHNKTKELLQQESTTQEVERVESYRRAVKTKTTSELVQDGFGIFEKREGNDEYNHFVESLHEKADSVFASNDSEVQAKAMLLGVAAPVYRGMYEATEAKLAEALKEIQNLKGARASFTGQSQPDGSNPSQKALENTKNITKLLSDELDLLK